MRRDVAAAPTCSRRTRAGTTTRPRALRCGGARPRRARQGRRRGRRRRGGGGADGGADGGGGAAGGRAPGGGRRRVLRRHYHEPLGSRMQPRPATRMQVRANARRDAFFPRYDPNSPLLLLPQPVAPHTDTLSLDLKAAPASPRRPSPAARSCSRPRVPPGGREAPRDGHRPALRAAGAKEQPAPLPRAPGARARAAQRAEYPLARTRRARAALARRRAARRRYPTADHAAPTSPPPATPTAAADAARPPPPWPGRAARVRCRRRADAVTGGAAFDEVDARSPRRRDGVVRAFAGDAPALAPHCRRGGGGRLRERGRLEDEHDAAVSRTAEARRLSLSSLRSTTSTTRSTTRCTSSAACASRCARGSRG